MNKLALSALLAAAALAPAASAQSVDIPVALGGVFENPSNNSTAQGTADLSLNTATGVLSYDVTVTGMTATAGHIHQAPAGSNGPIIVPFTMTGPNQFMGNAGLTAAQVSALLSDGLYVNIHSGAFPAGEIRGQIRVPRNLGAVALAGNTATPPTPSNGTGTGLLVYNPSNKTFDYNVTASGLIGNPTVAHLHQAPPGSPGPIIFGFNQTGPGQWSGTSPPLTDTQILSILSGGTYVNVHSTAHPGGEIRDQVRIGCINADTDLICPTNGGTARMAIAGGPTNAGQLFLVLGSTSGSSPGIPVGTDILPLNLDAFFNFMLTSPNTPPFTNSFGTLDALGNGETVFSVPSGTNPALIGVKFTFSVVFICITPAGVVIKVFEVTICIQNS